MINSQRKKEIIEYLSDTDYRTLKDIAEKFGISMNSIQSGFPKGQHQKTGIELSVRHGDAVFFPPRNP